MRYVCCKHNSPVRPRTRAPSVWYWGEGDSSRSPSAECPRGLSMTTCAGTFAQPGVLPLEKTKFSVRGTASLIFNTAFGLCDTCTSPRTALCALLAVHQSCHVGSSLWRPPEGQLPHNFLRETQVSSAWERGERLRTKSRGTRGKPA